MNATYTETHAWMSLPFTLMKSHNDESFSPSFSPYIPDVKCVIWRWHGWYDSLRVIMTHDSRRVIMTSHYDCLTRKCHYDHNGNVFTNGQHDHNVGTIIMTHYDTYVWMSLPITLMASHYDSWRVVMTTHHDESLCLSHVWMSLPYICKHYDKQS